MDEMVWLFIRPRCPRYLRLARMFGIAFLVLPVALGNCVAAATDVPPLKSTVCELVRDSAIFLNTPVVIRARINSNGVDRASLSSSDCPGHSMTLEHMGIESPPSNVGRDALFTAIFRIGSIGTVGRLTKIASDVFAK